MVLQQTFPSVDHYHQILAFYRGGQNRNFPHAFLPGKDRKLPKSEDPMNPDSAQFKEFMGMP